MKNLFQLLAVIFIVLFLACNSDDEEPGMQDGYEGYTLEWSDDFNSVINTNNWNYELGDGTDYGLPPGWGNSEKQLYTDSQNNARVRTDDEGNSALSIVALESSPGNYSSAKLTTQQLQSFRFGRIEAKVKVPEGKGLWPAFWLLGENITEVEWPGCGEIDIMEVIGDTPSVIHSSAHWTNDENRTESDTESLDYGVNLGEDYHIYRVDWEPASMVFSVDNQVVNTIPIEADMKEFLRSSYIIFNIAVGGNWPGDPDETTVFPKEMLIDWVRVYSKDDLNLPSEPPLDVDEETIGVLSNDIAGYAFNSQLDQFPGINLKSFGDGGEPFVFSSGEAIEGDSCLMLSYPGEGWGGAFFELDLTIDMSSFSSGNLVFSINKPADFDNIEIKLESLATAYSVFIKDYTGVEVANGFVEYTIPLSDFVDLDLKDLRIPMALWNPVNDAGDYVPGVILLDNIYLE